jgi:hypothetical protein
MDITFKFVVSEYRQYAMLPWHPILLIEEPNTSQDIVGIENG